MLVIFNRPTKRSTLDSLRLALPNPNQHLGRSHDPPTNFQLLMMIGRKGRSVDVLIHETSSRAKIDLLPMAVFRKRHKSVPYAASAEVRRAARRGRRPAGRHQVELAEQRRKHFRRSLAFETLKASELKTGRAWSIKECFGWFWEPHLSREEAEEYFGQWYAWAIRSRLEPVKKKARMLKRHLSELLNWCGHHITNAVSEGINSRIQSIKSAARGFRYFENYRTRILFFCGGLDLSPFKASH